MPELPNRHVKIAFEDGLWIRANKISFFLMGRVVGVLGVLHILAKLL